MNRFIGHVITLSACVWGLAAHAAVGPPPFVLQTEVRSVEQSIAISGDPADIYFPDPQGSAAGYRFPMVVFLQGANVDKKYYSQFGQQLASYGFIVAIPNKPGLFTSTKVIDDVFNHLKLEDADVDSPLYGIVDTDVLVASGHSFGGAAALVAVNDMCFGCASGQVYTAPPELKAVVGVAANTGVLKLNNAGIPTAIIVGDLNDGQQNYQTGFENMQFPRALMRVHGADHFGVVDIAEPPGAVIPDEDPQTMPQAVSVTRFAQYTGLFLRTWLYWDFIAWWRLASGGDEFVSVEMEYFTVHSSRVAP